MAKTTASKALADVKKGDRVPVKSIQEVVQLEEIKQEYDRLKAENPEVFSELQDIMDRYNAALENADKVVRARGVSCGPFDQFSVKISYESEKMYDELGEELFMQAGGSITTKTVYEIDKSKLELAIADKTVPEESIEHFRKVTKSYHAPEKLILP